MEAGGSRLGHLGRGGGGGGLDPPLFCHSLELAKRAPLQLQCIPSSIPSPLLVPLEVCSVWGEGVLPI